MCITFLRSKCKSDIFCIEMSDKILSLVTDWTVVECFVPYVPLVPYFFHLENKLKKNNTIFYNRTLRSGKNMEQLEQAPLIN